MNPYKILNLNDNANIEEVKKTFYFLAKKYHPDTAVDEKDRIEKTKKFSEITRAYNMIKSGFASNELKNEKQTDNSDTLYKRAIYFINIKDYNSAIGVLKKCVINEDNAETINYLFGVAFARKKKYHEALKYLQKSVDKNQWNIKAKLEMANIYEKISLQKSAEKIYTEILAIDKHNKQASEGLDRVSKPKGFSLKNIFKKA